MFTLPVSIGEAIDKLSILDIKIEKIKDPERNHHCKVEYDILYEQLKDCVSENQFYYKQLKDINTSIWEMQDDIRSSDNPSSKTCLDILNMNDSRFRIKDIINRKGQSILREQKGYPIKKAIFIGHQGLGDHINYIGAVRYLSLFYDEFVVLCTDDDKRRRNVDNVKSFYADNPNIKIATLSGYYTWIDINIIDAELNLKQYSTVYRLGVYRENRVVPDIYQLPDIWYNQLELSTSIRVSHFFLPENDESKNLYKSIEMPYIFIHRKSIDGVINIVNWDINTILTLDPDINLYSPSHIWYTLAESFVNKPFYYYYDTIRHAKEIHVTNSSFFCMAIHLKLDAGVKAVYDRYNGTLDERNMKLFN
jgi:hypothetical protein